jgi:hypothetical protein
VIRQYIDTALKQQFVVINHSLLIAHNIGCDLELNTNETKNALIGSIYRAFDFIFRNTSLARVCGFRLM